ncbi:MAG TPA: RNase adapter RapZ, partial [Nitrospirota bacterium]|nr:RNase adapter RapZ [Nitrospirota bacterium]
MKQTRTVVVTGLSGSGRSAVLKAFEDMGFYCVDNLPLVLLSAFVEFVQGAEDVLYSAIGIDIR